MQQKYQIISRRSNVNHLVSGLHKEESLSIGIMDTGSREDLEETIAWFYANYNHNLFLLTSADRMTADISQSKFPDMSYIVFDRAPSLAERANAMANNCMTTYFLLTRTDVELVAFNWAELSRVMANNEHPAMLTPLIFNKCKELVPTVRAPHRNGNEIDPLSFMPSRGTDENLYPFLGLGLYDRAVFQRIRGYDEELDSAYWQTLDFGTRCWLYGYPVYSVNDMALIFINKQFLIEDRSDTSTTDRYYTKALGVRIAHNRIVVKKGYRTDKKILVSEVKPRAGLYKTDFDNLTENWKIIEE